MSALFPQPLVESQIRPKNDRETLGRNGDLRNFMRKRLLETVSMKTPESPEYKHSRVHLRRYKRL